MCGIVAIVRRRATRSVPTSDEITALLPIVGDGLAADPAALAVLADGFEAVDVALKGVPGVTALVRDADLTALLTHRIDQVEGSITTLEAELEAADDTEGAEAINAALLRLKDAAWAIGRDRLRTARAVLELCDGIVTEASLEAMTSVQESLSAIDRLEVRGRDSAGLHLLVRGHGLDLTSDAVAATLRARGGDANFGSGSVRVADGHLSFVYKAAAEIGELGDNTAALRAAITSDELLHRALDNDSASVIEVFRGNA